MNDSKTYELQETINGVTFSYSEPGQNPLVSPALAPNLGDLEDLLLWVEGDSPMPVMEAMPLTGELVSILSYKAKRQWWRYTVDTRKQMWTRVGPSGNLSPEQPVGQLLVKEVTESGGHPLTKIAVGGPSGAYINVIYPGSTCRMVWNPATRQYTLVCS